MTGAIKNLKTRTRLTETNLMPRIARKPYEQGVNHDKQHQTVHQSYNP
jgi:hypothetical protein